MKLIQCKYDANAIDTVSTPQKYQNVGHPRVLSQAGFLSCRDSSIELQISFYMLSGLGFSHGAVTKVAPTKSMCFSVIWMLILFISSKNKPFFF